MTYKEILKQYWGYDDFRGIQKEIIESIGSGHDTLGLMPTGGGKSITFQVPALAQPGLCLVITPLIALMKDQVRNLRDRGIKALAVYSGMTREEIIVALENCIFGDYKFLYISPERLNTEIFRSKLRSMKVSMITVDESHCISQWGYDFRPAYLKIAEIRELLPDIPVLALTATATPEVVTDIQARLSFKKDSQVFRMSFERKNLAYIVRSTENKQEELLHILNSVPGCAIVYTRNRKRTREIAELLIKNSITATFYHAGLNNDVKDQRQKSWLTGESRVMVATNAFGMGIDKPDVRTVVHYDLPSSLEEYYQEAGRAGRDGRESFAVVIASPRDKATLSRRLSESFPDKEFIRHIYELAGNFLGVAVGEGYGMLYEFNFDLFCRTYSLPPAPTRSALTLLSRAGYFEYIDETTSRSRLMVIMRKDQLYDLELTPDAEEVFQCVLRNYTGLFADYVYISELVIARSTCLSSERVYQALLYLGRIHAVHYVPRRTTPYIYYSTSRELPKHVIMPLEVYERQRERMALRLEAMKSFAFNTSECRVRGMLRYFGESDAQDCGKCDVCRSRRKSADTPETTRSLRESIVYQASREGGCSVETIISNCQGPREQTIQTIRDLADKGIVRIDGHTVIAAKIQ